MLFNDPIFDTQQNNLSIAPGANVPGVGMADQNPIYTPEAADVAPESQMSEKQRAVSGMGIGEKITTAMGEFGAGIQGHPSPLQARINSEREAKKVKIDEFQAMTKAMDEGMTLSSKLSGTKRADFNKIYAAHMDKMSPGSGSIFSSLSEDTATLDIMQKYGDLSPTAKMQLEMDPTGQTLREGMKKNPELYIKEAKEGAKSKVVDRAKVIMAGLQQYVPPEMLAEFNKDGVITPSEFEKINDYIKNHPNKEYRIAAMGDGDMQVMRENGETMYPLANILAPSSEKKVEEARLVGRAEEKRSPVAVAKADLDAGRITKAEYNAIVKKETQLSDAGGLPTSTGFGTNPATGKEGHFTKDKSGKVTWDEIGPKVAAGEYKLPDGSTVTHEQLIQAYKTENRLIDPLDLKIMEKTDPKRAAEEKKKMDQTAPFHAWVKENYKIDVRGKGKTEETPLPMPKTKAELVTGKIYQTERGPAKWNGNAFTKAQ